ncbi:MAG: NAD(P)-dependent oxidoreductase [Peptococcaceae bacterium]|nr:hypothetical protein [Peptococcaceae bacterium]MDH7524217.1 NAD(P)-dependent oxidoreductase [Peptococcaceae bacterium]
MKPKMISLHKPQKKTSLNRNNFIWKNCCISIHVPLTSQTRDMINKQTLSLMKKTAVLINTAPAPL